MSASVLLALGAALGYGFADFLGGFYGRRLGIVAVLVVAHAAGFVVLGTLVAVFPLGVATAADLAWGAAAGVASMMGGFFLLRGFAVGRFSVVSTVAGLVTAGLPLLVDAAFGARPPALAWAGVAVALLAITLVTTGDVDVRDGRQSLAAGFGYALLSGLGYALMFLGLDLARPESGAWPAVAREGASVLTMLVAAWFTGRAVTVPRARLAGVAGIGVAAALATGSFVLSAQTGFVGIAAVIASMSPAVTIVLAWLLLAEKVTGRQVVGLIGTGIALVMIGLA